MKDALAGKTSLACKPSLITDYDYVDGLKVAVVGPFESDTNTTTVDPNTTTYEYDIEKQLVETINPDGTFIRSVYNAMGNVIETFDAPQSIPSIPRTPTRRQDKSPARTIPAHTTTLPTPIPSAIPTMTTAISRTAAYSSVQITRSTRTEAFRTSMTSTAIAWPRSVTARTTATSSMIAID
jgi:YD repeat-containing protein